jgi:hypothetical protein
MGASLFVSCGFVLWILNTYPTLFSIHYYFVTVDYTQLHHDQGQALQGLEHLRLQDR